jgi:hypothetical protein
MPASTTEEIDFNDDYQNAQSNHSVRSDRKSPTLLEPIKKYPT